MSRTLLLDADSYCYSLSAVHQYVFKWTPELYTYKGDLAGAKTAFDAELEKLMVATDCLGLIVVLSDTSSNFRKRISPSYKANRVTKEKPVLFKAMRDYLRERYDAVVKPHLEGDDVVSMLATEPGTDTVVCSIDKDCRTIPGWLYNPNKRTLEHNSPWRAEAFFLEQALMGDRVDGYTGCPGIGPKRAEKLLACNVEAMWPLIVEAYAKAGLSEAVALENARCARLLRHGEYTPERIRLWTPDGSEDWLEIG